MRREQLLNDAEEATRTAQHGHQAKIWTSLVGIIEAVDLKAETLSVQPAIQGQKRELDPATGEYVTKAVDMPLLVNVPIEWPQGGDFILTFPIKVGDECVVEFMSRPFDTWFQSGGIQPAIDTRMHDLSDGVARVGIRSQGRALADVSAEAVQLRSIDGKTVIELTDGGAVNVKAPEAISLEVPGAVFKLEPGKITIDAPIIAFRTAAGLVSLGGHLHAGGSPPTLPIVT